jgi:hypothetical protein
MNCCVKMEVFIAVKKLEHQKGRIGHREIMKGKPFVTLKRVFMELFTDTF